MTPYANNSRRSSVESYLIEDDAISVKFINNQMKYKYTALKNGSHIAKMKRLAISGSKLGGYIAKRQKELIFTKYY